VVIHTTADDGDVSTLVILRQQVTAVDYQRWSRPMPTFDRGLLPANLPGRQRELVGRRAHDAWLLRGRAIILRLRTDEERAYTPRAG
jgi:hypothetical protein